MAEYKDGQREMRHVWEADRRRGRSRPERREANARPERREANVRPQRGEASACPKHREASARADGWDGNSSEESVGIQDVIAKHFAPDRRYTRNAFKETALNALEDWEEMVKERKKQKHKEEAAEAEPRKQQAEEAARQEARRKAEERQAAQQRAQQAAGELNETIRKTRASQQQRVEELRETIRKTRARQEDDRQREGAEAMRKANPAEEAQRKAQAAAEARQEAARKAQAEEEEKAQREAQAAAEARQEAARKKAEAEEEARVADLKERWRRHQAGTAKIASTSSNASEQILIRQSPAQDNMPAPVPERAQSATGHGVDQAELGVRILGSFTADPVQPDGDSVHKTHDRKFPLPWALLCLFGGDVCYSKAMYLGHGQSKNVFQLERGTGQYDGKVLKMVPNTPKWDAELSSSVTLAQRGLAPRMLTWGFSQEKNDHGDVKETWQAWIVEPAMSLSERIPRLSDREAMRCLLKAVITMLRAFLLTGLVLSDNGLYNFGCSENGDVLIIDPGSRPCDRREIVLWKKIRLQ